MSIKILIRNLLHTVNLPKLGRGSRMKTITKRNVLYYRIIYFFHKLNYVQQQNLNLQTIQIQYPNKCALNLLLICTKISANYALQMMLF
jgi:hypothetical protein